jgi:surface protein
MMRSTALLCVASLLPAVAGSALDNDSIKTAVALWLSDSAAAEATYGHISTWETGAVTDMSNLFCGYDECDGSSWCSDCNSAAASFNEDISAWDTSGVTTMEGMFSDARSFNQDIGDWNTSGVKTMRAMFWMFDYGSAFNQDISDWAIYSVTDMEGMFWFASAFDQDLGWCVDYGVNLYEAFGSWDEDSAPRCAPTSCGVKQVAGGCAPTPAPTPAALASDGARTLSAALVPIVLFII